MGPLGVELLRSAGHDVMCLRDRGLQGERDETVYGVCAEEGRVGSHCNCCLIAHASSWPWRNRNLPQAPYGLLEPGRIRVHPRRD
ncbi:MAG: hypothetical protein JO172_05455 [Hyphomicrobiales bacterium]|nr:hypothetical protein [Hyphomicrobiales bacterium]